MKGGKSAFPEDFRFTSNPAPGPTQASGRSLAFPTVAGPIPDITVQGMRRPDIPLQRTYMPRDQTYSEELVQHVRDREELRHRPYLDLKTEGKPTIGYGHVLPDEHDPDMMWTTEQAEQQLRRDLDTARDAVRRQVSVPLTQGQLDALTSLVFNIGEGNYKGSQSQAKLHAGDYAGAATEMLTSIM